MEWDGAFLLWVQEWLRTPWLTAIFRVITVLGDGGWFWIAVAVLLLLIKKYRQAGGTTVLALLFSLLFVNLTVKNWVARVRPYEAVAGLERLIAEQVDYSFPSGHTSVSFAAATVILLMMPRLYGVLAMVLAVLISFSRLYVGVHYPTDVLAGMLFGVVSGLLAVAIWKQAKKRLTVRKEVK